MALVAKHLPLLHWAGYKRESVMSRFERRLLCDYLSDPRLRQDIQEALNVIEQWNSVNGFIFSGRGGELLSNRPEDQEAEL